MGVLAFLLLCSNPTGGCLDGAGGCTVLHRICFLLIDTFVRLQYGRTPLFAAAWNSLPEAVAILIEAGAEKDVMDNVSTFGLCRQLCLPFIGAEVPRTHR